MKIPFQINKRGKLARKYEKSPLWDKFEFLEISYVYAPYVPLMVTKLTLETK